MLPLTISLLFVLSALSAAPVSAIESNVAEGNVSESDLSEGTSGGNENVLTEEALEGAVQYGQVGSEGSPAAVSDGEATLDHVEAPGPGPKTGKRLLQADELLAGAVVLASALTGFTVTVGAGMTLGWFVYPLLFDHIIRTGSEAEFQSFAFQATFVAWRFVEMLALLAVATSALGLCAFVAAVLFMEPMQAVKVSWGGVLGVGGPWWEVRCWRGR